MKGCITANISNIDRICYKGLIRIRLQHRCVYQVTKRHILSICKTAGITMEVSLPNIFYTIYGGSDGKSICLQLRRPGFDPWVGKIPWRRKWQPTPVLLPWKSHGRRSLVGYSPWGRKESDTTKQLHFHFSFMYNIGFFGGSVVKNPPANAGDTRDVGLIPGWRDPSEKEMATHSSILAWEIPWTEESDRLQFMGSQKSQTRLKWLNNNKNV